MATPHTYTRWTAERIETLREKYPCAKSMRGLAAELGCTVRAMRNKASSLGIRRSRLNCRLLKYTREQFETVRKNYPRMSNRTLAVYSGVSIGAIRKWRYCNGWYKSEQYREECREYLNNLKSRAREHVLRHGAVEKAGNNSSQPN